MKKHRLLINLNVTLYLMIILTILIFAFSLRWPYPNMIPILGFNLQRIIIIIKPIIPVVFQSVLLSLGVSVFTVLICFPAAKSLVFYDFKGKSVIKLILILPIIVPIIAVVMGIHLTMIKLGLSDTILGVILVQIIPCIPYVIRMLMNSYEIVGNKIEIQAQVLGANKLEVFRYISFPLLAPAISSSLKMAFMLSYSQYLITLIIGGGIVKTHSTIIFPIIQSGSRSEIALNSAVFILSIVLVSAIIDKVFSYVKEAK